MPQVLHFHWAEHLCSRSSARRGLRDACHLLAGVIYAKASRFRIIYTVHNLEPHDPELPAINRAAHRFLLSMANGLHVHDDFAFTQLEERVRGGKPIFVIPHGHYIGVYPNACSRREARARLGIEDDAFTFLFLGQMRPHKGIEDLIGAFRRVAGGRDRLVLAGWAPQVGYGTKVRELADEDSRISVFGQFVADKDIQFFLNASDISVLPYRRMTTSGAAILSLSFGRPVIAPRRGGFPRLLRDGGGILYEPEDDGLPNALSSARCLDLGAAGSQAFSIARGLDWGSIARGHLAAYGEVMGNQARVLPLRSRPKGGEL